MTSQLVTIEEASRQAQKLVGMPVSLPWKGYGSAIFFELGELREEGRLRRRQAGAACIHLGWDWRVEHGTQVLYGSSDSRPEMDEGIRMLRGSTIASIHIVGPVPELLVNFSNGHRLISAAMSSGGPDWSLHLGDGLYLDGELRLGDGSNERSGEEGAAACDVADEVAQRWGAPVAEPKRGDCADCRWFKRIDADFALLDYGVCINHDSPFDGRAVNCRSSCGAFAP